jgi:hypothetical protein
MPTLLEILQSVAKQIPVAVPTLAVGSSDDTAQALLAAATWTAKHLHRIHDWSVLTKEHTFTTLATVASAALPADFDRLVTDSAWDRSDFDRLQGALSPQDWQLLKSGNLSTAFTVTSFRLKPVAGLLKVFLDPTPTATSNLVFEYISTQWAQAQGGSPQSDWLADTDSPILDPHLIELGTLARELRRLGMSYDEEAFEFERMLGLRIANDGAVAKTLSILPRTFGPAFLSTGSIPDGNWHQ